MAKVTGDDLLDPKGPILLELFPETDRRDVVIRLQGYLDTGYALPKVAALTEADQDAPATAYALFRAYRAVWARLSAAPASLTITDKGTHAYFAEQIRNMKTLADEQQAILDDLTLVTEPDEPGAGTARNTYVF